MRPVQLPPAAPAGYPQAQLQAEPLVLKAIAPFTPVPVQQRVDACAFEQRRLIDAWLHNRLGEKDGLKSLSPDPEENVVQNSAFKSYAGALGDDQGYGYARPALIANIGAYCSYCEIPLSANLAVEHMLPKSWFPQWQLEWPNFLLCCPICNSKKGAKPFQDFDDAYHETADAVPLLLQRFAWPQLYWQTWQGWPSAAPGGPGPVLPFTYVLVRLVPFKGGWREGEPVLDAAGLAALVDAFEQGQSLITSGALGFASATSANPGQGKFAFYQLKILPRTDAAVPAHVTRAVANLIDLVGLNVVQPPVYQDTSDLRGAYRTQAYFRALSLFRRMDRAAQQNAPAAPLMTIAITSLMTLTGFWSVWSYVFRAMDGQTQVNQAFPGTPDIPWIG